MKNTKLSATYQIAQGSALCWSPVASLRSAIHNTSNTFNMIEAGKDYSRVHEGYDD